MTKGKKSPTRKKRRPIYPEVILICAILTLLLSGFVIGRITAPTAELSTISVGTVVDETVNSVETKTEYETECETELNNVENCKTEDWIEFKATAYCPCEKCCGVWAKRRPLDSEGNPIVYGATGIVLRQGVSVAADTTLYSMGTQLELEGLGTYVVEDRGGAIKGNRLDIYFDNHQDALEFGVQTIRARVVE